MICAFTRALLTVMPEKKRTCDTRFTRYQQITPSGRFRSNSSRAKAHVATICKFANQSRGVKSELFSRFFLFVSVMNLARNASGPVFCGGRLVVPSSKARVRVSGVET